MWICQTMDARARLSFELVRAPAQRPSWRACSSSPAGRLAELFDKLHDLEDPAEVVRLSALHDVDFLPPGSVEGA